MRIVKNVFFNGAVQVSGIFINLLLMPYITRVLGKDALGINSFGQAVASYFVLLGNLGIIIYGARSIAERRDNSFEKQEKFSQCITYQFFFNAISILLFNIWVQFQGTESCVYFLFNLVLFTSMTDLAWAYTGMERFDLVALRNITIKVIGTLLIFIFVKEQQDLFLFILIQQGVLFMSNIVYWSQLKKIGLNIKFASIKESLVNTFRPALALFVPSIFTVIYLSLNKVMLGYLSTIGEVAIYDYPNRLVRIAITLVGVLGTVMMPRLSYLRHSGNLDGFLEKVKQMFYGSMLCSIPIVYILILTATELCELFFTNSFIGSDLVMRIVAPTIILSGLSLYIIFVSMNNTKLLTKSVAVGSIVNVVLNFILIPHFHATGAAIATLTTELFVHVFLLYYLRNTISIIWLIKIFLITALIGLIPFLLLFNLNFSNQIVSVLILSFGYLLIYGILIFVTQRKKIETVFFMDKSLFQLLNNKIRK